MLDRFSSHINTWQKDRWQQALEESAEIGFQGIELNPHHFELWQDQTEDLQEHLKKNALQLLSTEYQADVIYPDRQEAILKNIAPRLAFLKRMHANLLILYTGQRELLQDKKLDFTTATETINELGKLCLDHDCYLCVMTQFNSRICDHEDIDRLLNSVDTSAVFLGVDTAHIQRTGSQPNDIIKTYGECLKHIRLQDVYPTGEEQKEGNLYAPLGEGSIRFRPIIKSLDELHYDGWLGITLDSQADDPAEAMETSMHQLQEWIKTKDEPEPKDPFAYGGLSFR
jgi:inosose dehydratase